MANTTNYTCTYSALLFVFVLPLFLGFSSPADPLKYVKLPIETLHQRTTCVPLNESAAGTKGKSSVLPLVGRLGPCSPYFNSTGSTNISQLLLLDNSRIRWIHSRITRDQVAAEQATLPATWGSLVGDSNFIVSIGLGTPRQEFTVQFDTGSDITWVQCEPCLVSCHPQHGPRFSPDRSTTFKYVPCNSSPCTELAAEREQAGCSAGRCLYRVAYGDGSSTTGLFGVDTLTLATDRFLNFPFGCGESNTGTFGAEAGLLGLGRRRLSLAAFSASYYGGIFSYCLPTGRATGFLRFGPDGPNPSSPLSFVSLLSGPGLHPTFYYVPLVQMSVGGVLLPLPPTVFSMPGTILDSGTTITRLPSAAYAALQSRFMGLMMRYRKAPAYQILDTCYDFSGYSYVVLPSVAFHFQGGTTLVLDGDKIMVGVGGGRYCLAFASTTSIGIIGNWQQRKTQIVHDLIHSRVGFRPGACF